MFGLPDLHATFTLLLTALALYLFGRDRLPLEASALAILVVLVTVFQLFPYERDGAELRAASLLSGFGHEALIAISALMIVGKGLEVTGALQPLGAALAQTWADRPRSAGLITMLIAMVIRSAVDCLSGFELISQAFHRPRQSLQVMPVQQFA